MELFKLFTCILLSTCILFSTSDCLSVDIADIQRDNTNFSNFCFEKYINTVLIDTTNIVHTFIIGSDWLTTNFESSNLFYEHRNGFYWTVMAVDDARSLLYLPNCTHIVWITTRIEHLDLDVLRKLNGDHLVAIHVILQQSNPLAPILLNQKLRYIKDNIVNKIYVVHQIGSENGQIKCQVLIAQNTAHQNRNVKINTFTSQLQMCNFQAVPVFIRNRKRTLNVLAREYIPYYFQSKFQGVQRGVDHLLLQMIVDKLYLDANITVIAKNEHLKQFCLK